MSLKITDIRMGGIKEEYKIDFGVRPDMKFENYLKKEGLLSMSRVLKIIKNMDNYNIDKIKRIGFPNTVKDNKLIAEIKESVCDIFYK